MVPKYPNKCLSEYVSFATQERFSVENEGLLLNDEFYQFLSGMPDDIKIPDFTKTHKPNDTIKLSLDMYDFQGSKDVYKNFLSWLFKTFNVEEDVFRRGLISKLNPAECKRVLITGCGIGDDVIALLNHPEFDGVIFANDLSSEMVVATLDAVAKNSDSINRVSLSVCDASHLPFEDNFFDASFHFGGINLFPDIRIAISEMARVTKNGGVVLFGDEGVSPWLVDTEYGHMVVANNHLWAHQPPINFLPFSAVDVSLSWTLGNCFYLIQFNKNESGPFIDIDVPHLGRRGGTIRTRYYGMLEGVSPAVKDEVLKIAREKNLSVSAWLEDVIGRALNSK